MVELRRKGKSTPKSILPPETPEAWISKANADGEAEGVAIARRYISFAIDNLTLGLFKELGFVLKKGNVDTLATIIDYCADLQIEDFKSFPESHVISGNTKRTMSFLLPNHTIDKINALANLLHFQNKSALYRYLIQFKGYKIGIVIKLS